MKSRASAIGGVALLLALSAALAVPATASAVTAVQESGSIVRAISDPGEANHVRVDIDTGTGDATVEDSEGITVTPPCVLVLGEAHCPFLGGSRRFIVQSGDRGDTVSEGLTLIVFGALLDPPPYPIIFDLGRGNDTAIGGFGPDQISGGTGNDRMVGFDGDDRIFGGPGSDLLDKPLGALSSGLNGGRDSYWAGPGADTIRARDFTRDIRISCGSGRDNLRRDRFDPRPRRCP